MNADDTMPLMTWRARPDMSCERVSQAWLDFTGLTREAALGQGVHPEDLARWLDTCVRSFDERRPFEIEYRLRHHDGEYRWVLERAAPLYEGDAFVGYAGACVDIDEHKRRQLDLVRALERERRLRVAAEEASRHLLDLAQARAPLLAGVKVLVVDADRAARDALVRVLGVAGADVRAVASPAEAPATLGAWQPDVLLSGEGDSLIRALRSLPSDGRLAACRTGCDARLSKPVEPVALLATVARLAA